MESSQQPFECSRCNSRSDPVLNPGSKSVVRVPVRTLGAQRARSIKVHSHLVIANSVSIEPAAVHSISVPTSTTALSLKASSVLNAWQRGSAVGQGDRPSLADAVHPQLLAVVLVDVPVELNLTRPESTLGGGALDLKGVCLCRPDFKVFWKPEEELAKRSEPPLDLSRNQRAGDACCAAVRDFVLPKLGVANRDFAAVRRRGIELHAPF